MDCEFSDLKQKTITRMLFSRKMSKYVQNACFEQVKNRQQLMSLNLWSFDQKNK